jgi:hypothetical protein
MSKNAGKVDRVVRGLLGVGAWAAAVYRFDPSEGIGLGLSIVGLVLLVTSLIGFCPGYRLLGINTCKVKPSSAPEAAETAHAAGDAAGPENPS